MAAGRGVKQNLATAVFWYRFAANLGYVPAMRALSQALRSGTGVPKDEKQALEWEEKANAASKGVPR